MKNAGRIMPLPKGEYNSAVTYNLLDFVTHDGSSYICKKESMGNTPSENSEYWQLMARKGSSGGAVTSVNGMDGDVTLTAEDVGALSGEDNVFLGKRGIISGEDLDDFVLRKSGGYAVQRTDHTDMLTVFAISAHSTSALEFLHKYDMSFLRVRSTIDNNRYSPWKEIAFTTSNVTSATKATQDKNGNDIVNTYATKKEMNAVKKSVSDGKTLVANAITAKGVTTATDAEFATMATNIGRIQTGVNTSDATAVAANILSGKTAYVKGSKVTGTMAEKAGVTVDATATTQDSNYTYLNLPEGHYSATSKVRTPNSNLSSNKIEFDVVLTAYLGQLSSCIKFERKKYKKITVNTMVSGLFFCTFNTIANGTYPLGNEQKNRITIPANKDFIIDPTKYTDSYLCIMHESTTSGAPNVHIALET